MHAAPFRSNLLRVLEFLQVKKGDLISAVNRFCRKCELFEPPFCSSYLKVLRPQFHSHSIDLDASCMIQEYFSQSIEISTN